MVTLDVAIQFWMSESILEERLFTFAALIYNDHNFIVVFHSFLCSVLTVTVGVLATRKMMAVPTGLQNLYEWVICAMLNVGKEAIGEELARKYFPLAGTIGMFVFYCNVVGMVPGFEAPTSSWSFTLVLALVVFFYYHFEGIRTHGFSKYFSHFAGPIRILSPLMFPVEVISHLSRIISLSFRLFGNVKGDDMYLLVMLQLIPWLVPVLPFFILGFMAILQAFVFMILTYVYVASAVMIDEGH